MSTFFLKSCAGKNGGMETYPKEKVESKQEVFQADGSTLFLFLFIDPHAAKHRRF